MKTKLQKKEAIRKISKKIDEAGMIVFTAYSREGEGGLSVSQMRELKKALKKAGGDYLVAKKNLIKISLGQSYLAGLAPDEFDGSLGLTFGVKGVDSAQLAKAIQNFAKNNQMFKVYGAILENRYLDAGRFDELAKLPSREIMLGRLAGMMKYPSAALVNILRGNITNLLLVFKNIKK